MKWKKLGLVIRPRPELWWMKTHVMTPTVEQMEGPYFRVYFSGRDNQNRSHIGYAVLDISAHGKIVEFSSAPVFTLGELGCFDDNGVTPSCVVNSNETRLLYYIGWNKGATVRMHLFAGLAISDDGGESFRRYSRTPILERTDSEPFLNTAPCVLKDHGFWRMYYVSGIEWVNPDLPRYHIKYAESQDGLVWDRRGTVCIDLKSPNEHALARPWVCKDRGIYRMWFSYKGNHYRIGYAESEDGIHWERHDDRAGINVSPSGWDSEMIEYACIFEHQAVKYMLYNGNNYGRDGVGLAIAE